MMGDYFLTYFSMHTLGMVEEANYLMVWLMEMPFGEDIICVFRDTSYSFCGAWDSGLSLLYYPLFLKHKLH